MSKNVSKTFPKPLQNLSKNLSKIDPKTSPKPIQKPLQNRPPKNWVLRVYIYTILEQPGLTLEREARLIGGTILR